MKKVKWLFTHKVPQAFWGHSGNHKYGAIGIENAKTVSMENENTRVLGQKKKLFEKWKWGKYKWNYMLFL